MKVRLVEDGPQRFVAGGETFEPGDVKEVSDGLGEHLLEKPHFVDADAAEPAEAEADEGADEFDVDAWLDQDFGERADRVEAGDVDDQLDAIADAETSDTVLDAVGVRRAELEE